VPTCTPRPRRCGWVFRTSTLAVEHDRRRLGNELLLAVGLLGQPADLFTQLGVGLAKRVNLLAERVRGRSVERGGADHETDRQREENRGQRHDVVPKVDHFAAS
jgi:hypothetical protein